jgi:hypothetical protein
MEIQLYASLPYLLPNYNHKIQTEHLSHIFVKTH